MPAVASPAGMPFGKGVGELFFTAWFGTPTSIRSGGRYERHCARTLADAALFRTIPGAGVAHPRQSTSICAHLWQHTWHQSATKKEAILALSTTYNLAPPPTLAEKGTKKRAKARKSAQYLTVPVQRRLAETVSEVRRSWGAKYALRKAVNRLTGPMKTLKNAHNTGFSGMARPGSERLGVRHLARKRGPTGSESPFVSSGQALG
jgi:hypothetical protein